MRKKTFCVIIGAVLVFTISGVLYYKTFISNNETVVEHNEPLLNQEIVDNETNSDGDIIEIDIPNRTINVKLSDEELASRPMQPLKRNRVVSKSLKAYAQSVSSADKGGVRII